MPDVRIVAGKKPKRSESPAWDDGGGVAVIEPITATTLVLHEVREMRIEIVDAHGRNVVRVIEVLSPANKIPAAKGRKSYTNKRLEVMQSPSHFVEIDLLRAGDPMPIEGTLPANDYRIHVSRVEQRPQSRPWMFSVRDRLPIAPIPIKSPDPDVILELRPILDTAYDRAAYDLEIDYRRDSVFRCRVLVHESV